MKTILAITLLIGTLVKPLAAQDKIGKHYDFSKVVQLQAVIERYAEGKKDYQYFEPLKTRFQAPAEASNFCKVIKDAGALEAGNGPFIGHLCHIVMLDKDDKIVAMVSILNYDSLCSIHGAHRDKDGRIIADYETKAFGFTSYDLARAFYDRLRRDDAPYMEKMDRFYSEAGESVEQLLFGKKNGEQDGGGQPSTRPESK
jgi:hypothetical protein